MGDGNAVENLGSSGIGDVKPIDNFRNSCMGDLNLVDNFGKSDMGNVNYVDNFGNSDPYRSLNHVRRLANADSIVVNHVYRASSCQSRRPL
jgi:hypothetical protein